MPYHYKQFKPGSSEYKKAYAEHMVKKLKKRRKGDTSGDTGQSGYSVALGPRRVNPGEGH